MQNYKKYIAIGFAIFICVFCAYKFLFGTGTESDNVDRTVQSIKSDNRHAGESIKSARDQVNESAEDISRAVTRVEHIEKRVTSQSTEINDCVELVKQLRTNNSTAKQIIRDVEQGNKSGTKESQKE